MSAGRTRPLPDFPPPPSPPMPRQSLTYCGKCAHPMHWKQCVAEDPMAIGACRCRNDQSELPTALVERVGAAMDWYVGLSTNVESFIGALRAQGIALVSEESLFVAMRKHDTGEPHCDASCAHPLFKELI